MTLRTLSKKYRFLILSVLLFCAIALLLFDLVIPKTPPPSPNSERAVNTPSRMEAADLHIGQYRERTNARLPSAAANLAAVGARTAKGEALLPGCALFFSFTPKTKVPLPGESIFYTATLKNGGKATCVNASFSVYYSGDEIFIGATPRPTASTYYWKVGTLRSRDSFTVDIQTKPEPLPNLTQIQNQACATADNAGGDVCADNIIFIQEQTAAVVPPTPVPPPPSIASVNTTLPPAEKEFGIWVWDSPIEMSGDERRTVLENVALYHFNTVYVTIDDYLDIAALADGATKNTKKTAYFDAIASFIALAQSKGIAVDVEGGARDWAQSANRWKGYALIAAVKEYNGTHPQVKIHGLQYDVEPYLLQNYETDKATVLREYLEFIDGSVALATSMDGAFSIVIPHFYDDTQAWTPQITFNGKTNYTYNHLLDILEKKPKSTMLIMAYRNYFEGDGGTRQIANVEIQEASQSQYSTRIIVAQETGNVSPAYVTFYGFSKSDFLNNLSTIYSAFQNTQGFGGVAVHYIDPFLALK